MKVKGVGYKDQEKVKGVGCKDQEKAKGVGCKDQEKDESSEKKNLSLEGEGNIKKVWKKGRREWG